MAIDSKEFVVKITADARGAVDTIDKVEEKLEATAKSAEAMGESMKGSEGLGSALASSAGQMAQSMQKAFDYSASMQRAFASASSAVEPLGALLSEELGGVRAKFSEASAGLGDLEKRLVSSQASLDGFGDKLKQALEGLGADAPRKASNEIISLASTVEKLTKAYDKEAEKVIDIKLALKEATEQLGRLESAQAGIVDAAQKELTIAESRLEEFKYKAQENIEAGFKVPKGLSATISTLESRIATLRAGIEGDHSVLPGYSEYARESATLSARIGELQGKLAEESKAMEAVDKRTELYAVRIKAVTDANAKAGTSAGKAGGKLASLGQVLAGVGTKLASVAKSAGAFARSVAGIASQGFRNIASTAGKIGSSIGSWGKQAQTVGDAVKALHKRFTSFFSMLVSRLKRMAITAIFKDITAVSGRIGKISSEYNASLSGMANSARAFGAQVVAAFAPIISTVGPSVSRLLDMMAQGADRLAQFNARLTGNDTYIKAGKGLYDYASSVDSATASTNKATKASEKFRATVMSFDELHRLEGSETDDAGVEAVTGVSDATLSKAQTQATALNELADRLRGAWGRGDYKGVGMIAAMELGKLFDWLKGVAGWSANADKFRDILAGVADAVNGFFVALDGSRIGSAIGDVANTLINGFAELVQRIDPKQIGTQLGMLVSSFSTEVNWTQAGQNIIAGLQFALDMVSSFLSTGALARLGSGIAEFFAGLVNDFDPEKVGPILAQVVNSIAEFLANALNPETFKEAGTKLGETVSIMFANLDTEQVQEGINNLVGALTGFINSAIGATDWSEVGKTLGEIGKGLDWAGIAELIGIAALPAVLHLAVGLGGKAVLGLGGALLSGIPVLVGLIGKGLAALGAVAGAGIPVLIAGAIAAVVAALVLNWDKVKKWASGAWESIKKWGGKVAEFFSKLLSGAVSAVKGIGSSIAGLAGGAVDVVKGIGSGIADIAGGIAGGVKDAGSWISGKFQGLRDSLMPDSFRTAETAVPDAPVIASPMVLSETSLACADTEAVLNRINQGFQTAIAQATTAILNALGQSGDINLYVDSERLARATVRGLNLADIRQNATGNLAFV